MKIKPTTKILTIFSAMATGYLPWGVKLRETDLTRSGRTRMFEYGDKPPHSWPLCCGFVFTDEEVEILLQAGLLTQIGKDKMRLTAQGKQWLADNWPEACDNARWI